MEIKRIHAELGTTFVYVTHDQDEALVLSDRIAVFNDGKIEQVGTAKELYELPRTAFVAQFLGESSLFQGVATLGADGDGVEGVFGTLYGRHGEAQAGSPAALVVRPERIRLVPVGGVGPAGNAVTGRILQEIYLGSSRKLQIELADGSQVLARESAGDISALVPGDEAWVTFRAEDAVLLPTRGPAVPAKAVEASLAN